MRHLSQQMLSEELRRPHLKRYRRHLQQSLRDHALGQVTRKHMLSELKRLGQPKAYGATEAPPPGAIEPGPMPQPEIELDLEGATRESLLAVPHTKLHLYALQRGLDSKPSDTKVQTVQRILDVIEGGDR